MNSSSDSTELSPIVPHSITTDSLNTDPNITDKIEISSGFVPKISNVSVSKSFVAGLIFIGLAATFFVFTKGTEICFWSDCSNTNTGHTGGQMGEFWAFAGGAGTLMVLTTLVGMPLLPAVAVSTGVWLLMQYFH
ncbi:hypothetical protein [Chamaesiphon sp.]|uniref:hypothetical protein n=1 Tax=Chamaesiphon sp. TaxID=2814140 RepID=UPI003593FD24